MIGERDDVKQSGEFLSPIRRIGLALEQAEGQ